MTEERAPRRRPPRQKPILAPVPRAFRLSLPRPPTESLSVGAIAAIVLAAGYAIAAIALIARRYDSFALTDPILPAYTQAMWGLLRGSPEGTLLGGSLFARHLHLAIVALLPAFTIFPSPIFLLGAQAVAIAAGALPLHAIARRRLAGVALPTAIVVAHLLYAAIGCESLDRFRMKSLAVPFLFGAHLAFLRDRRRALALCLGAVALVRGDLALFGVGYAILLAARRRAFLYAAAVGAGSLLYMVLAGKIVLSSGRVPWTIDWIEAPLSRRPEIVVLGSIALIEVLRGFHRLIPNRVAHTMLGGAALVGILVWGARLAPLEERARLGDVPLNAREISTRKRLLDTLPKDAPIVVSREIVPHVCLRKHAYSLDRPQSADRFRFDDGRQFPEARYALIDCAQVPVFRDGTLATRIYSRAFAEGSWQVLYAVGNLVLLHRPMTANGSAPPATRPFAGEPQLFERVTNASKTWTTPLLIVDGKLELADARLVEAPVHAGDRARVSLVWRLHSSEPRWYYTTLYILDERETALASLVHPICYNLSSPFLWEVGEVVREDVWLPVPDDLPAGRYRIALRMETRDRGRPVTCEPLSPGMALEGGDGRFVVASWEQP